MTPECRCPSTGELEQLIAECDAHDEDSTIVRHIGECSHCQEQLEKLA
ncbi:MAG: hypothetical protein JNG89_00390, partial [Planctomycetaceae bacterium]|nr:hypothetical protein [Planctomycetaceae bacterium]